jgi:FkbM family methyltransferase
MWLGLYERRVQKVFDLAVRNEAVVWDIGAHAGLYSLLAARRGARVFAFEPLRENVAWLERNAAANGLEHHIRIQPYALGAVSGRVGFERERTRMEGRLGEGADGAVDVYRADELDLPPPDLVKLDVEGAELDVLRGMAAIVRSRRPRLFLEVHEPVPIGQCLELLPGYHARELEPKRFVCTAT